LKRENLVFIFDFLFFIQQSDLKEAFIGANKNHNPAELVFIWQKKKVTNWKSY
jgi:hypothetical protein